LAFSFPGCFHAPFRPSSGLPFFSPQNTFPRAKLFPIPHHELMSGTRAISNVALIGFMGTGKSAVGRALAEILQFTFVDTDQLIEAKASKSIKDIFAQDGESAFRDLESQVVEELAARTNSVISTGGGLPTREQNMRSLKAHALVVCLWAAPETIFERTRYASHRPLLNDPDPLGRIRQLLAAREACYRQADVLVNTEMRSVREVALQVAHQFHQAQSSNV
jgi:shikimate kinase